MRVLREDFIMSKLCKFSTFYIISFNEIRKLFFIRIRFPRVFSRQCDGVISMIDIFKGDKFFWMENFLDLDPIEKENLLNTKLINFTLIKIINANIDE